MSSFSLRPVPTIVAESGCADRLGALLQDRFDVRRALVVTDTGVRSLGLLDGALESLGGWEVEIFDQVSSDPPEQTIVDGAECARSCGAEIIIGFGGGSPLDAAKAIAILACSKQPIDDMYGTDMVRGRRLPLVLVPTTAGTGSETSPFAVITRPDGEKVSITCDQSVPDVAVLDARLTTGLPPHLTAATGIDAMVHAIEAYTSRVTKNPVSDAMAEKALALLWSGVRGSLENGGDIAAREQALLGAALAGQAIANAPVGAIHALAYPLGGLFHIHHGLANALMAVPVMQFNLEAARHQYDDLARASAVAVDADSLIAELSGMINGCGIATRLRDVGITEADLATLAADAMKVRRLIDNNPRDVGERDALELYKSAF